ncbi:MAG: hypothetical protein WKF84_26915 [Pyrinomonadaceae bacterium]
MIIDKQKLAAMISRVKRLDCKRVKTATNLIDVREGQQMIVRAIREQNKDSLLVSVYPATCTSKSSVPETFRRKARTRRRIRCRR